MSASFYDLLKYAKTGIAAPSMTYYDKLKALAMCKAGFPVKTLTGVPPITFQSDGTALTAWSISGNMTQTGTPTPSAPITPQETGDKTANLWANFKDHSNYGVTITKHDDGLYFSGTSTQNGNFVVYGSLKAGTYTISANANRVPVDENTSCIQIYKADAISKYVTNANAVSGYTTFEISEDMDDVQFRIRVENGVNYDGFILRPMLNTGSTALPYEPYGYKIPITIAGQTQTIYLSEPLRKALDGSDAVDVLRSDGTLTREVDSDGNALQTPTAETVTVPTLTPTKGSNTLSVGTTLQPSEVSITGGIK